MFIGLLVFFNFYDIVSKYVSVLCSLGADIQAKPGKLEAPIQYNNWRAGRSDASFQYTTFFQRPQ